MKKVFSIIAFILISVLLLLPLNQILQAKHQNRYYMLAEEIKKLDRCDVQVFGSCHAYTSFNAKRFEDSTNISTYVVAAPSEIIPATYLRMLDGFKTNKPKVAILEYWGVNPYETYIEKDSIFKDYFPANIELFSISKEKNEVISRYDTLDLYAENIPLYRYKERFANGSLVKLDFDFTFEFTEDLSREMKIRFDNNGYLKNEDFRIWPEGYLEKQAKVGDDEKLEIESDIMYYLEKIVDLCEENDVELIIYRAPYIACKNEMRKLNWFTDYCEQNNLTFVDLEKEIEFDHLNDFYDWEHLNERGANKVTDFLRPYIFNALNKQ